MITSIKTITKIAKMPKNKKGNINQKRSHKFLEEFFGVVYTPPKPAFGSKGVDVFNCFDHVCVATKNVEIELVIPKADYSLTMEIKEGDVLFVQTKSNKGYFASRAAISEFVKKTKVNAKAIQIAWIDMQEMPYLEIVIESMTKKNEVNFYQFILRGVQCSTNQTTDTEVSKK